jgi:hypothetical protein
MARWVGNPNVIRSGTEIIDPPPTRVFMVPENKPPKNRRITAINSMVTRRFS